MNITLEQLLEARDRRRRMQIDLLDNHPGCTLLVLTVNIPGSEKRTSASVAIGAAGVKELLTAIGPELVTFNVRDLQTGYEAYFVTKIPPSEAKRMAVEIEDTHPLGRIFDIDVMQTGGLPISGETIGRPARKCLICGRPARECMRSRRHSVGELLVEINRIHDGYFQRT